MASKSNYPAELKLWSSVLSLTIQDYATGIVRGSHTIDFYSAEDWIFADNQTPKNSFDNICYLCNLNPDSLRDKLKNDAEGILQRITNRVPKEEVCTITN